MSPLSTVEQQIDKSLNLPSHKLNVKILIVFLIAMGVVIYYGSQLIVAQYKERITYLERKLENAEACCTDCKEQRLNDYKDWNMKLDTIKKKVSK